MSIPLTDKQKAILDYISSYEAEHKSRPSMSQIQRHFGLASLHAVRRHLVLLEKKGSITWPKKFVVASQSPSNTDSRLAWLPFLTETPPSAPTEQTKDFLLMDRKLFPDMADLFVFKVKDDRMIDAEIYEGDLVVAHRGASAPSGKISIVRVGDEVLVQRLIRRSGGHYTLRSENNAYEDIKISPDSDFAIEGTVVGLWRLPV